MLYNDEIVIAIYSHEGLVLCWSVLLENEKGKHHSDEPLTILNELLWYPQHSGQQWNENSDTFWKKDFLADLYLKVDVYIPWGIPWRFIR